VAVHLGSLPWPKPPQFSGGSLLRPKPFAVLRVGPLPGRGLSDCPVDRCFDRSLRSFPVDRRLDRNPPGSPEERRLGRSLLISPFGVRRDRSLWRVSRIPAWAEALAVHRSVPRVRPKPWRFTCPETPCRPKPIGLFRPARMSAEAGTLSGLAARQSRSPGGSPPKRRVGRGRSVSPVRIPFGAEAPSGSPLAVP
jgi:hypothetical protein